MVDNTRLLDDDSDNDDSDDARVLQEFYALTYESAVLVGPSGSSPSKAGAKRTSRKPFTFSPTPPAPPSPSPASRYDLDPPRSDAEAAGPCASQIGNAAAPLAGTTTLTREIMDALLPPKTWQDARGKWQRMARMTPATRNEVLAFEDALNELLDVRQARSSAICPVREQLFLHTFDEMIREVALECPERGLMLLRVRDELRLTVEAYQTLYHNSIAYGRTKAVQAESGLAELEKEQKIRETQRDALIVTRRELELRAVRMETREESESSAREQRHAQELVFLRQQHEELSLFHREMSKGP